MTSVEVIKAEELLLDHVEDHRCTMACGTRMFLWRKLVEAQGCALDDGTYGTALPDCYNQDCRADLVFCVSH